MATLNTLRTRGAIILTVFIGVALIAFLLQDLTGASSIFQSRKNRIGSVGRNNIDYMEFMSESENMNQVIQTLYGRNSLSAEETDRVREMVWESFVRRYSYDPGYRRLGLAVGEQEQIDMVQGQYTSPVISMMFTSPQTGVVDQAALSSFVASLDQDNTGRMSALWQYAKTEMVNERMLSKYMALVAAGTFVNDLEVTRGTDAANTSYAGTYAMVPFTAIADSLVNVSSSEVKKYFRDHRDNYKQSASRDIEYVVFELSPSESDFADAAAHIATVAEEFAVAEEPMQYASLNSHERIDAAYYTRDKLSTEIGSLVAAFNAGRRSEMAGPTLAGNLYTISRVADRRMMPDSVGARHILLDRTRAASADSIVRAVKGGASMFDLAPAYSLDSTVDLGIFQPETMVEPFANALIAARTGDVFKVETQFGTHVVQMTHSSPAVAKYRIATVKYNVDPSPATEQAAYNSARDFLTAAAGSKEKFDAAVSSTGASLRVATIGEKERNVRGLADSRELVRWSFNSKVGATSPIMDIDGDYVVAILTGAKEAGIADVRDVSQEIAQRLRTDKKAAMLTERIAGKSIDEIASLEGAKRGEFANLKFSAFYEPSIGMEPAVIGAVSGLQAGSVSKPVKGYNGMFVVAVDNATQDAGTNETDERVRLQANAETSLPQRLMQALSEGSDIEDYRAKFF